MKKSAFSVSPSFLIPLFLLFGKSPFSEVLAFLGAVALHEGGHLLAMLLCGTPCRALRLSLSGARLETCDPYLPYKKEALIYLAGPFAGCLGAMGSVLYLRWRFDRTGMLFFSFNLLLTLFNLLPVKGLDGSGALHAVCCNLGEEERAEKITSAVHNAFLLLLTLFSLWVWQKEQNPSLMILTSVFVAGGTKKEKKPRSSRSFFTRSFTQQR